MRNIDVADISTWCCTRTPVVGGIGCGYWTISSLPSAPTPGLWNPTGSELSRYWTEKYPARTHLKLEPSIWRDYPGSLS